MLADLTRDDWLEALAISPDEAPSALVLRGTRNLKSQCARHRTLLTDARELASANGIFEDILLGWHQGTRIALACVYGAPMASEVAHAFCVLGVSRLILTGCCGALVPKISAGDMLVPQAAFPGDGASRYYGTDGSTVVPADPELHRSAVGLLGRHERAVHQGSIYTTCALCAESAADVAAWAAEGYLAVDMETATTYATARHFGVPAVAMLFAFDCLAEGESIVLTDADKAQRRSQGDALVMAAALHLACANDDVAASGR